MATMGYRGYLTVRGTGHENGEHWEALHRYLDAELADFGPVMSFADDSREAEVILSADEPDHATAGQTFSDALYQALKAVGLGQCYVASEELEEIKRAAVPA